MRWYSAGRGVYSFLEGSAARPGGVVKRTALSRTSEMVESLIAMLNRICPPLAIVVVCWVFMRREAWREWEWSDVPFGSVHCCVATPVSG